MAVVSFNFESQYLGNGHVVTVILPDKPRSVDAKKFYESGKKYKVLWLLHGTFDDSTGWLRRSMIEVYAREKNLIVVMPNGLNADYTNWDNFATGFKMGDYLTEELMPVIHNWFPASSKREDNYIAGLSMGGAGALKYALAHPDKFCACGVLSAAPSNPAHIDWEGIDPDNRWGMSNARFRTRVENAGGKEAFLASDENSWDKVIRVHKEGKLPKLFVACGDKDRGYPEYLEFRQLCQDLKIDADFFELPNLAHEWRFWDPAIEKAIESFGITEEGFLAF